MLRTSDCSDSFRPSNPGAFIHQTNATNARAIDPHQVFGPTNYRVPGSPQRISDGEQTQRVTLSWDHSMDGLENASGSACAVPVLAI